MTKFIFEQSPFVRLLRIPGLALPGLEFLLHGEWKHECFFKQENIFCRLKKNWRIFVSLTSKNCLSPCLFSQI